MKLFVIDHPENMSRRTLIYCTYDTSAVVIINQISTSSTLWENDGSLMIPMETFTCVAGLLGLTEMQANSHHVLTLNKRKDLPDNLRNLLFKYDCENIPLSENQLGSYYETKVLAALWDIAETEAEEDNKENIPPPTSETDCVVSSSGCSPDLFDDDDEGELIPSSTATTTTPNTLDGQKPIESFAPKKRHLTRNVTNFVARAPLRRSLFSEEF